MCAVSKDECEKLVTSLSNMTIHQTEESLQLDISSLQGVDPNTGVATAGTSKGGVSFGFVMLGICYMMLYDVMLRHVM